MLDKLTTEARNPASMKIDTLDARQIVQLMNQEDAKVAQAVAKEQEAIAKAIDVIADRFQQGGRLIYMGAGTSGRLGVLDASECPPTFNSPPEQVVGLIAGGRDALTRAIEGAEDHPELGVEDLKSLDVTSKDVVVGIATSGRTPYVLGGIEYAKSIGAFTVGFSCNEDSAVTKAADLAIAPVVGPEVVSGSTRLKAGTATKMVLNMLTTGAMVRIGKTFGNLMVDLRATNTKLKDRSVRIVQNLTELPAEKAEALLARCNGEVKTSVVAHHLQLTAEQARQRLTECGGQVREALQSESGKILN